MFPSEVWCLMSCVKDQQTCVFENACGYRKQFLRSFKRKQHQSMKRHSKRNGFPHDPYDPRHESYIPYDELLSLAQIYLREGFKCYYCGKVMCIGEPNAKNGCSVDHKKPITNGGSNSLDNIVLCCEGCNVRKGERENYGK